MADQYETTTSHGKLAAIQVATEAFTPPTSAKLTVEGKTIEFFAGVAITVPLAHRAFYRQIFRS